MHAAHQGILHVLLAVALTPAMLLAQVDDKAGSISTIDSKSGLVTVVAHGRATQRFHFLVAQAGLRARLRPGQSVMVNLKTGTGRVGGQSLRLESVLTQVEVTPKLRASMLCSTLQAAMNASLGDVPAGIPTPLWTCVAQQIAGGNEYWCRCTPHFSF